MKVIFGTLILFFVLFVQIHAHDALEYGDVIPNLYTQADLDTYIAETILPDTNVGEVEISEEHVLLEYRQHVKLYGFLNTTMMAEATVDREGNVNIRFPWYRIFTKHNSDSIEADLGEGARKLGLRDGPPPENLIKQNQQMLQMMHSVLKVRFTAH